MIKTEAYGVNSEGVELVRTYSDKEMIIEREGALYCEAIDPADTNRQYVETNISTEENNEVV